MIQNTSSLGWRILRYSLHAPPSLLLGAVCVRSSRGPPPTKRTLGRTARLDPRVKKGSCAESLGPWPSERLPQLLGGSFLANDPGALPPRKQTNRASPSLEGVLLLKTPTFAILLTTSNIPKSIRMYDKQSCNSLGGRFRLSPMTASTLAGVGRTISLQIVKMFWWQVKQNTKIGSVCARRERGRPGRGRGQSVPKPPWRGNIAATPPDKNASTYIPAAVFFKKTTASPAGKTQPQPTHIGAIHCHRMTRSRGAAGKNAPASPLLNRLRA